MGIKINKNKKYPLSEIFFCLYFNGSWLFKVAMFHMAIKLLSFQILFNVFTFMVIAGIGYFIYYQKKVLGNKNT